MTKTMQKSGFNDKPKVVIINFYFFDKYSELHPQTKTKATQIMEIW